MGGSVVKMDMPRHKKRRKKSPRQNDKRYGKHRIVKLTNAWGDRVFFAANRADKAVRKLQGCLKRNEIKPLAFKELIGGFDQMIHETDTYLDDFATAVRKLDAKKAAAIAGDNGNGNGNGNGKGGSVATGEMTMNMLPSYKDVKDTGRAEMMFAKTIIAERMFPLVMGFDRAGFVLDYAFKISIINPDQYVQLHEELEQHISRIEDAATELDSIRLAVSRV